MPALRFLLAGYIREVDWRQHASAHLAGALSVLGQRQIVGDENEAKSFTSLQLFEETDDFGLGVLVEVARRLVGEQKRRRVDQRTGNHHAALFATGHAVRIGVSAAGQTDTRQEIVGPRIGLPDIHRTAEQSRNSDVVDGGQVRQQTGELKDEADMATTEGRERCFRQRPDVAAVEQYFAFRRFC